MKPIEKKNTESVVKSGIANEVKNMIDAGQNPPHLAAILVGSTSAGEAYIVSKKQACKEVGFTSSVYRLPEKTTEKELLQTIGFLNNDEDVDGYIVQFPLPKHINPNSIVYAIDPKKDVGSKNNLTTLLQTVLAKTKQRQGGVSPTQTSYLKATLNSALIACLLLLHSPAKAYTEKDLLQKCLRAYARKHCVGR